MQQRTLLVVVRAPAFVAGFEFSVGGGFGDDVFQEGQVVDAADCVGCGDGTMRRSRLDICIGEAPLTKVFVLDGPPRFSLGFDDVHGLVGEVAYEHLLNWINCLLESGWLGVDRTVAIVIAKAAFAET